VYPTLSWGLYYVLETSWQTGNQGLCCYYDEEQEPVMAAPAVAVDIVI
jgi:hypothetical protein